MRVEAAVFAALCTGCAAVALGAGTASALAVDPSPGAATVTFSSGEAAAVSDLNLGPALGQLVPGWSPSGKSAVGEDISWAAGLAATDPAGSMFITLYGSPLDPDKVTVGATTHH